MTVTVPREAETLMTLLDGASSIGLPVAVLRTEQRKGRLQTIQLAGKHYVTTTLLREMVERCRVVPKAQDSTSEQEVGKADGLSETDQQKIARDAALMTVRALKKRSRVTS